MSDSLSVFVRSFFEGLGIQMTTLETTIENTDIFVRVETEDSHLLIGVHGKNLELLKHLLSRMLEKQAGHFVHMHLEVNDYMKAKDERLFRFLDTKIEFVQSTGKTIRIANLSSFERKKAHNYISEKHIEGLNTHSEGDGEERALFLGYSGTLNETPKQKDKPTSSNNESRLMDLSEDGVGI